MSSASEAESRRKINGIRRRAAARNPLGAIRASVRSKIARLRFIDRPRPISVSDSVSFPGVRRKKATLRPAGLIYAAFSYLDSHLVRGIYRFRRPARNYDSKHS